MTPKYRSGYTLGDQVLYADSADPKNDVYVITGVIEEADAPFDYLITPLPLTAPPNEILAKSEQLSLKKKGKTKENTK